MEVKDLMADDTSVVTSKDFYRDPIKDEKSKPNNRVVYTIFAATSYIDLNVIKER